jgi:large subunit ribosomal protein L30
MATAKPPKTAAHVRITLKKSPIGTPERHRLVQSVVRPDTPQVRGLIHQVGYLLEVQPS